MTLLLLVAAVVLVAVWAGAVFGWPAVCLVVGVACLLLAVVRDRYDETRRRAVVPDERA